MARKANSRNGTLEAAMALLVQNQAALVAQHAKFLDKWAETQETFARIEKDLETIKAVLVRHEATLERLPEAIREKIGFKRR